MNEARVIIADADEDYRFMMGEIIDETPGLTMFGEAASTAEALELLRNNDADLLLMDLLLPGGDGICLLSQLKELECRPAVVVNTSFLSPVMAAACAKLSVACVLQKPTDADTVVERLLSAAQYRKERVQRVPRESEDMLLRRCATETLQKLGFGAHYKGYAYLREALVKAMEHDEITRGTLKMIYTDVARSCGATIGSIEKAIRTMNQNHVALRREMGQIPPEKGYSNLELIAALHQKMCRETGAKQKICR